jgi:hypothetical protein
VSSSFAPCLFLFNTCQGGFLFFKSRPGGSFYKKKGRVSSRKKRQANVSLFSFIKVLA